MPYHVKTGVLTIVAATVEAALTLFDEWVQAGKEAVSIRDMEGNPIDPDTLRDMTDWLRTPE